MNPVVQKRLELGFALFLLAVFGVYFVAGLNYPRQPRELPLLVAGIGAVLVAVQLLRLAVARVGKGGAAGVAINWRVTGLMFLLIAATLVIARLVGLIAAVAVLTLLGGRVIAARPWRLMVLVAAGAAVFMYLLFGVLLRVPLPGGVLLEAWLGR